MQIHTFCSESDRYSLPRLCMRVSRADAHVHEHRTPASRRTQAAGFNVTVTFSRSRENAASSFNFPSVFIRKTKVPLKSPELCQVHPLLSKNTPTMGKQKVPFPFSLKLSPWWSFQNFPRNYQIYEQIKMETQSDLSHNSPFLKWFPCFPSLHQNKTKQEGESSLRSQRAQGDTHSRAGETISRRTLCLPRNPCWKKSHYAPGILLSVPKSYLICSKLKSLSSLPQLSNRCHCLPNRRLGNLNSLCVASIP